MDGLPTLEKGVGLGGQVESALGFTSLPVCGVVGSPRDTDNTLRLSIWDQKYPHYYLREGK